MGQHAADCRVDRKLFLSFFFAQDYHTNGLFGHIYSNSIQAKEQLYAYVCELLIETLLVFLLQEITAKMHYWIQLYRRSFKMHIVFV